jgi:RNA polymerase sigma-70 factor (ECF subfamily)
MIFEDGEIRSKLEQIYISYRKDGLWTAYKVLNDMHEGEDIVQEAIIKISSIIEEIDDINCNKTRVLFVIIVRNLSINTYNRRKKISSTPYDDKLEIHSDELSLDEEIIRLEKAKLIAEKLEKINPSYADILTLKYYHDYSNVEISQLLDIREGNVRARLHRAKKAIKEVLEQEVDFVEF